MHDARAAHGEKDGVDYHFFDAAEFLKRLHAGNFLEHATVYGNSYGILKSELLGKLREGKDVLLNVDVQGAATIREQAESEPELKRALVTIFLTPTTLAEIGRAIEKARRGRRSRDSKTARGGETGNRAVEKF